MPTCQENTEVVSVSLKMLSVCVSTREEWCDGPCYLPAMAIDVVLHIHTYSTGALVQNSKLRLVIKQASHLQQTKSYWLRVSYIYVQVR